MNKDTIIGGYTLDELKVVQNAVRKDASKIIADAIKNATTALDEILKLADDADTSDLDPDEDGYAEALVITLEARAKIDALAIVAEENLSLANTVSSISGVQYYLPYSSEYESEGYYYDLECSNIDMDDDGPLTTVMDSLEDMESQSRQWHQSNC